MPDVAAAHFAEHRAVAESVDSLLPTVGEVTTRLCKALAEGGRLYTFGNGGSAADAQHLAAELIGRYKRDRRPLPAVALTVDPSVVTCIANDYAWDDVFARQVEALARPGDVVAAFTTSGTSENVVRGLTAGAPRRRDDGAVRWRCRLGGRWPGGGAGRPRARGPVRNDCPDPGDARAAAPCRQRGRRRMGGR